MSSKILKKLTIRSAVGTKQDLLAYAMTGQTVTKDDAGKEHRSATGKDVPILRVLGEVTGFKAGQSDYGSYAELQGIFVATNLQTGEVTDGIAKCILPDAIGDPLASAIHSGADAVQFAVEISVAFDMAAATMYVFNARNLLPASTPKPIEALEARMKSLGIKMTEPLKLSAPTLTAEQMKEQEESGKRADALKAEAAAKAAPPTKAGKTPATAK